jgi:hypothetical protein
MLGSTDTLVSALKWTNESDITIGEIIQINSEVYDGTSAVERVRTEKSAWRAGCVSRVLREIGISLNAAEAQVLMA